MAPGVTSRETMVAEIMSKRVVFVWPEQTVEECLGLISIGDAVKEIIAEKEHLISQLENYILSG